MKPSTSHIVFRNTLYNFITQIILTGVMLWSLPLIVNGLSAELFGLLTILWALIGYFTLLDFGISRANVKYLSEAIGTERNDEVSKVIWTSLSISFCIGIFSGLLIITLAPYIVQDMLGIGNELSGEAIQSIAAIGISAPFLLVFGAVKGFQMAFQRFDLVNIFQMLISVVQAIGSVLLIVYGYGIIEIILLTVISRIIISILSIAIMPIVVPNFFSTFMIFDKPTAKKMFSFGGWVSISQLISPLFLYLDRVIIALFLPLSAVAYYTVPQEAITRVLVLPMSLTTTLFPALSSQFVQTSNENKSGFFYQNSLKYLSLIMLPLIASMVLFSEDFLKAWIGIEFAKSSAVVFQILAIGLFFNALAQIPATLLHSFGRPDITAKYHLIELPIMILLNILLIPAIGILGAAITWTIRVIIDSVLLMVTANKQLTRFHLNEHSTWSLKYITVFSVIVILCLMMLLLLHDVYTKMLLTLIISGFYIIVVWKYVFEDYDREFILRYRL